MHARLAERALNLQINRGDAFGLVGEFGSGKSVAGLGALGLLPLAASPSSRALLGGADLLTANPGQLARIRGGALPWPENSRAAIRQAGRGQDGARGRPGNRRMGL